MYQVSLDPLLSICPFSSTLIGFYLLSLKNRALWVLALRLPSKFIPTKSRQETLMPACMTIECPRDSVLSVAGSACDTDRMVCLWKSGVEYFCPSVGHMPTRSMKKWLWSNSIVIVNKIISYCLSIAHYARQSAHQFWPIALLKFYALYEVRTVVCPILC